MGLTGTMWTGLSGLFATSESIGVTSDNIANLNTIGHRGSRAQFEDVLARSIVGVGQIGSGTRLARIQQLFEQGSVVGTGRGTDMAINGRGFFVARGSHNGGDGQYYTRNGEFELKEGYLTTSSGMRIQGYQADGAGGFVSALGDLRIPTEMASETTSEATFGGNLPTGTRDGLSGNPGDPIVPADPTTYSHSETIEVVDGRGARQTVTLYFRDDGAGNWEYAGYADPDALDPASTNPVTIGTLSFDTDGQLVPSATSHSATMTFLDGPAQTIALDFEGITNTGDGAENLTVEANGHRRGDFESMEVDQHGVVRARYSNGEQFTVARVALADFSHLEGLDRAGGGMFAATVDSGDPVIGFAGAGGRGGIAPNSLEQSNVDLPTEFVRLITDQRAYQATSRTITTADELLQETVNLKR